MNTLDDMMREEESKAEGSRDRIYYCTVFIQDYRKMSSVLAPSFHSPLRTIRYSTGRYGMVRWCIREMTIRIQSDYIFFQKSFFCFQYRHSSLLFASKGR